jgi:hypothetical protein
MNSKQAAAEYWRGVSELKVIRVAMQNHISKSYDQGVQDILTTLVDAVVAVELDKRANNEPFPDLNKTIDDISKIEVQATIEIHECLKVQA